MLEVAQQTQQSLFTWPGWRLEFCWKSDRWQHILWRKRPTGWQPEIHSLEGRPDQPWPDSPAFQNAFVERINPDCCEVQLLGQAGKNHYSAAIRCDAAKGNVTFDMAVRVHAEPPVPLLMSSYFDFSARDGKNGPGCAWIIESITQQPPLVLDVIPDKAGGAVTRLLVRDFQELRMEKRRATLRWKYEWRLNPNA